MDPEEILTNWFGRELDSPDAVRAKFALWFQSDEEVDAYLRESYLEGIRDAAAGEHDRWRREPRSALALILVFDQFSRNIFRGSGEAFSYDALARELTNGMLESGWDTELHPVEATFVYLPLEHSESLADQDRCVELYRKLHERSPAGMEDQFAGYIDYAIQHRDIIERFGRFPHRNEVLGRETSEEERVFLASGDHSFGQG